MITVLFCHSFQSIQMYVCIMKVVQPVQTFGFSSSNILILDLDVQLGLYIFNWFQYCTKHSIKNSFLTARCYICCKIVSTLQGPFSMQSNKNMTKNNMIKILNNTKTKLFSISLFIIIIFTLPKSSPYSK